MQTRVQVYYGSHAISSCENRTIAEHQQDFKCKIVKLSKKSIGTLITLILRTQRWNKSQEGPPTMICISTNSKTRKIPVTVNTRSLRNKYDEKS